MDSRDQQAVMAEALAQIADLLSVLREAVDGYRAQMESAGYDAATARQMAADYHGYLLAMLKAGMS